MSNSVRFEVDQKELDSSNNVSDEKEYSFAPTFSFFNKQTFTALSGNTWKTINFGLVTTSTAVRIFSDKEVSIRMNGGVEVFTLQKGMIFIGSLTALDIKNNSGSTATITIEIYGN